MGKITVENVDICEDELELLKKEVNRFYEEVKEVVIDKTLHKLEIEEETAWFGSDDGSDSGVKIPLEEFLKIFDDIVISLPPIYKPVILILRNLLPIISTFLPTS